MNNSDRKFELEIEISEFIENEDILSSIPIFNNSEICLGIDDLLETLEGFTQRTQNFIKIKLKNGIKKHDKKIR